MVEPASFYQGEVCTVNLGERNNAKWTKIRRRHDDRDVGRDETTHDIIVLHTWYGDTVRCRFFVVGIIPLGIKRIFLLLMLRV